jgi:hypothetical protein
MTIPDFPTALEADAYDRGFEHAEDYWRPIETEDIIRLLKNYFDLTRFSEQEEGAQPNPEWDAGFQAAIALVERYAK